MIKLTDITLRIKKIKQGRFGDFCVADLISDIGEFKVKDPLLDQFNDGEYTGTAWISEIYLAQYIAWGKAITEIRARLHDLQLNSMGELPPEAGPSEPDPAEEVPAARRTQQPQPAVAPADTATAHIADLKQRLQELGRKPKTTATEPKTETPDKAYKELFGDLWADITNRAPVKFDPTVDRLVIRQQSAAMHKLGYEFKPIEQTWYPV